jgi:hypothetical protein
MLKSGRAAVYIWHGAQS